MLRSVAWLKRIAKAQERCAVALESIAESQRSRAVVPGKRAKLAQVYTPSNTEVNRIYDEEHDPYG